MRERASRDVRLGETWTPWQRRKNDAIYAAARVGLALATRAPRPIVRASAQALGWLAWATWREGRRAAEASLRRAMGDRAPSTRALFAGLATTLADTLDVLSAKPGAPLPLTLPDASREVLEAALAEGRGVVFATAHLGAWEAIGPVLASHGFDVATIARRSYDPRFDRVYDRLRGAHGVRSLYRGDPGFTKALVKCLRGGVVVGFTMDLAGRGVRTVTIPWPDGERPTPIGPAEIALRTRSPVVIGTAAPGRILRIEAVSPRTDDDPRALTETIAAVLGTRLLAYPSAWPWMHRGPREEITAGSLPTLAHGR